MWIYLKVENNMDAGQIRKKLANGEASIGSWLQLPCADVAEIMAQAGYDWIAVDMEHGSFGVAMLPDIFRGIQCGNAAPFARLPQASRVWIKAALEAGAQGLIFPMIESAEELGHAVDLSTYPDQTGWQGAHNPGNSRRGVGFCRANGFGKYFDSYKSGLAREIFLVAQIEHVNAVHTLENILRNTRLDAIMVGPYDLSGSMGITGQFDHPDFVRVMARISRICQERNVVMGCHVVDPDPALLAATIERGSRFIAYGIDSVFLWKAAAFPRSIFPASGGISPDAGDAK